MARQFWLAALVGLAAVASVGIRADTAWAPAIPGGTVDLLTQANIRIDGAAAGEFSGASVANVGDVNGDGIPDIAIGALTASNNGRTHSGSVYVVFGRRTKGTIDLANLGSGGFRIDGAAIGSRFGVAVAGAGDMNGDGKADIIVGADEAEAASRGGSVYVIFGKSSSSTVDTANLGNQGFQILGPRQQFSTFGRWVAGVGDVGGDSHPDVAIAANSSGQGGTVYVIYGKSTSTPVDVSNLGSSGMTFTGAGFGDGLGSGVAALGDVNGDGRPDFAIGDAYGSPNGRQGAGIDYVIFGGGLSGTIPIANLGTRGFEIDGAAAKDADDVYYGGTVAGVGDVNGDGRPDILVTRPYADPNGRDKAGSAYVVFGKATKNPVDLAALGGGGFRIDGAAAGDSIDTGAGVGDVNGDGRPDVAVGSFSADNNGRTDSGSVWVVLGKASSSPVDLASLGTGGFRIDGAAAGDKLNAVAGGGDWSGDGKPDIVVGAGSASNNGRANSGSTYVVFSGGSTPPPPPPPPPPPGPPPPPPPPGPPPPPQKGPLKVTSFTMTPVRPRAARRFDVRLDIRIAATGEKVRTAVPTCTGSINGAPLTPTKQVFSGSATQCSWAIPRSAGEKTFQGSIQATLGRYNATRFFGRLIRKP